MWEHVWALAIGIGLAASCGFRVFVPMLVASIFAKCGVLTLSPEFAWAATWPAIVAFSVATIVEVVAYYVPWLDNALDTIAGPAAAVAGILMVGALAVDMHPLLRWSLALIAGGGVAGTIKLGAATVRVGSTATTGGAANPVQSTGELIGSVFFSVLSVLAPLIALAMLLLTTVCAWRTFRWWRKRRERKAAERVDRQASQVSAERA